MSLARLNLSGHYHNQAVSTSTTAPLQGRLQLHSMLNWLAVICAIILLVPWVVYPAVMRLLGALFDSRTTSASCTDSPMVSIVIATREVPEAVAARVANCLASKYRPDRLEVIVVVDPTGPPPSSFISQCIDPRVNVIQAEGSGGKAASLNAGVALARGEIVVLTDTHQQFVPGAVRELVASLETDPGLGAVSGSLEIPATGRWNSPLGWYWRLERRLREDEATIHSSVGVSGSVYAIRREHWVPLAPGLLLDDLYVPMRVVLAGYRVGFARHAVAFDLRETSPQQEYQRKVRTLTGNLQLMAWLPEVLLPLRNPIWFQFVCHKILRLLTPYALMGLTLWASVRATTVLAPRGRLAVLGALVALTFWLGLERGRLAKEVRLVLAWLVLLQTAPVTAAVNGLRGRWNVWH